MGTIEEQLSSAWESVTREHEGFIEKGGKTIKNDVDHELQVLLQSVRQILSDDQPGIEAEVKKLVRMAEQFHDGVEMWHRKAQSGIRVIEEKQRELGLLVQDSAVRTATRREDLLKRQRERTEEVRERCTLLLRESALDAQGPEGR